MSETRKIAAILVADIVGYSRLRGSGRGSHFGAAHAMKDSTKRRRSRIYLIEPIEPREGSRKAMTEGWLWTI
jgi:hypothetical protein